MPEADPGATDCTTSGTLLVTGAEMAKSTALRGARTPVGQLRFEQQQRAEPEHHDNGCYRPEDRSGYVWRAAPLVLNFSTCFVYRRRRILFRCDLGEAFLDCNAKFDRGLWAHERIFFDHVRHERTQTRRHIL